ncbi:MAG: polysaccharide deacetylase family protein [Ruminiclostridium sp.]
MLIIVPTVMCIILAVDNAKKSAEIDRLHSCIDELSQSSASKAENSSVTNSTAEPSSSDSVSKEETSATSSETSSLPETTESQVSVPEQTTAVETTSGNPDSQPPSSVPVTDYTELYPELYADKYEGEYEDSENTVYLTFDDGPSVLTANLLYYLRQENVKATFFVVPERTELCYSMLKEISDAGHTIGIHSASHDYEKIYASVDAFLDDYNEAYQMIVEATGKAPEIYRFPGGSINDYNSDTRDEIIEEMSRRGFTYFDWNVDINDWQGIGWTELYTDTLKCAEELTSPVILFHNTGDRDNTILVIEDVIKALKNKGYNFGCLSQKTKPVQF